MDRQHITDIVKCLHSIPMLVKIPKHPSLPIVLGFIVHPDMGEIAEEVLYLKTLSLLLDTLSMNCGNFSELIPKFYFLIVISIYSLI